MIEEVALVAPSGYELESPSNPEEQKPSKQSDQLKALSDENDLCQQSTSIKIDQKPHDEKKQEKPTKLKLLSPIHDPEELKEIKL